MKILHVTNAVGWSGGCQQLTYLIEGLEAKGHENILVCPPKSELILRLSRTSTPIEIFHMIQDYDLIAAYHLRNVIRRYSPDVVHAHHSMAHAIALVSLMLKESPSLVVSRRVSFKPRKNIFSLWKYRSKKICRYVAVSQSIKQTLMEGGVPSKRIEVIYSAYDANSFFPQEPNKKILEELKIPEGYKVVGKLANYSHWKGQKIFLEAAKILLQENKKIIFVLVGKETEKLEEKARELGILSSIRLLGFRKDIPQILSTFHLSINSAIDGEGLSGAMRESLAMNIPVIASNVSGNREIVQDGITGILIPRKDPSSLAKKISYALENEHSMEEMTRHGSQWVKENCSLNTMVEQHIQLYESL